MPDIFIGLSSEFSAISMSEPMETQDAIADAGATAIDSIMVMNSKILTRAHIGELQSVVNPTLSSQ